MNGTKHARGRVAAAALLCTAALTFSGCGQGINESATLINVNNGEDKITLGYGNFAAKIRQASYDDYFTELYGVADYWSSPSGEEETAITEQESVKGDVINDMEEWYVYRQHAADYDIELSDEQKKVIADTVDKFFKDNSEETLKIMGAKEEYLTYYLEDQIYEDMVQDACEAEGAKKIKYDDVIQSSFSYVHVFNDVRADDYVEKSEDELKSAAEAAAGADDFDAVAKEQGLEVETDVYTRGMDPEKAAKEFMMPKEIYAALNDLKKEGNISGVIPVEDSGYYVVRLDKLEDKEETEAELENQISSYFEDLRDKWLQETEWEVNEKEWDKVRFDTLFISEATQKKLDEGSEAGEEAAEEGTEETGEEAVEEDAAETDEKASEEGTEETGEEAVEEDAAETDEKTSEEGSEKKGEKASEDNSDDSADSAEE